MESIELTLEQQFKLQVLENHTRGLSQKQLQKLLLKAVRLGMLKDNLIERHIREQQTESFLRIYLKIDTFHQPNKSF